MDHTPSRHEKSLGLLTTKFVSLLQEAQDGVLDLKVAADQLAVRQKRRIYDITNVLEGIGLIDKKSKNSIQWKGAGPGCNSREISERLIHLKDEIADLEQRERELDQHRMWVQQSIKNVTDDADNHQMAYVTHDDICKCFEGDTLLAIQAPSGTQLEVPIPEGLINQKKRYQIHLKSHSGPIYVLLVNKDTDSTAPVVVQVPPPKEGENQNPDGPPPLKRAKTSRSPAAKSLLSASGSDVQPTRMATRSSPRRLQIVDPMPEPLITDPLKDISSDLQLFDPGSGDVIDELMSQESLAPLLRLSPPPSERDYYFNLDDSEGVYDLFDVPF